MQIELKKFGTSLVSRESGHEALAAIQPELAEVKEEEQIEIIFEGLNNMSPSWGSEFIDNLIMKFGEDRVILERTTNLAVLSTLEFLEEEVNHKSYRYLP